MLSDKTAEQMRDRLKIATELGEGNTFIVCDSIWHYGARDVHVRLGAITSMWIEKR